MELRTQDHFTAHQLHRLWHALRDLDDAGWDFAVEITQRKILHINLEARDGERMGPFHDFHRLVEACPKEVHVLICQFHNGGTADAGEYVLTFRDGC